MLCCMAAWSLSAVAQTDDDGLAYFKERVKTLGSDAFGGRKPLTEYETKTINYIADEFKALGLEPANNGSYFQAVKEIATYTRPQNNKITVKGSKGKTDLKFSDDIVVWTNRGTEKVLIPNAEYVFVGFGINAPEYNWNDYEGLDVKGKIVIAMVNDPDLLVVDDIERQLDAHDSRRIADELRKIAHEKGKTVIVAVTEPASAGDSDFTIELEWSEEDGI